MTTVVYDYQPHPRQALLHATTGVDEILYGGSSGGGKSRAARAEAVRMALLVPGSRTILFRRSFPDLQRAVVDYLRAEMPPGIARYNVTEHQWRFTNGSVIELAYLDSDADVYNYQGAEFQLVIFEEVTQFTEKQYKYLLSRLRAAGIVLERMRALGWRPRMIATGNPGGIGHAWVKARWIDPAPPETPFTPEPTETDPDPLTRMFIPARVSDNPSIDIQAYDRTLAALDPALRRALRDGDWDVLEGVRFGQWRRATHVIDPTVIDLPIIDYPRAVAVDWGISDPFCALWLALLPGGLVYVYRELYATDLSPKQQCAAILAAEAEGERIPGRPIPVVCDPAMWARSPHQPSVKQDPDRTWAPPGSIARTYQETFGRGAVLKANNARITGWALLDELMVVDKAGLPRLLVSEVCTNLIRTLPALPRYRVDPNDVDTKAEDHAADALRYGCMYLAGGGIKRAVESTPRVTVAPVTAGLRSAAF